MILGRITGKLTTTNFNFLVEGDAKKFQYCQVYHKDYEYVLCQIVELEKDTEKTLAKCNVIGYSLEDNIKQIRTPFEPDAEVLKAEDELIRNVINLDTKEAAFMGRLEGRDIPIYLDLNYLLTKHISILAKSGSGKSYTTGVLIEEIIEKKVPLLIIDPHGEYSDLKHPNTEKEELAKLELLPKSYKEHLQEYGDIDLNPEVKPLALNSNLNTEELIHILPTKLSNSQQSLLYSVMRENTNLDSFSLELQNTQNPAKFSILSVISNIQKLKLFSEAFTPYNELIQPGKASIINLRGMDPDTQGIIVYKLLKDLFEQRKQNKIPPFFCVLEESHNFAPERGFGEAKSSKILRTIASEGRKFGLGLCIVSQRPARVDKNVLSQCSTQIILRITNPNDLKAILSTVEGLTNESENAIPNLPIGTAMITGIVDLPLFVIVRPRKSKHGGDAPIMLENGIDMINETKKFEARNILPIIPPKLSINDLKLSSEHEIEKITTYLIPVIQFRCAKDAQEFLLIIDQIRGEIITNISKSDTIKIPNVNQFSANELNIIRTALNLDKFTEDQIVTGSPLNPDITRSLFTSLLKKNVIDFKDSKYFVNKSFNLLFSPESLATYENVEYKEIPYDQKLDKKLSLEELRNKISDFVSITDAKECYIVYHHAEYTTSLQSRI